MAKGKGDDGMTQYAVIYDDHHHNCYDTIFGLFNNKNEARTFMEKCERFVLDTWNDARSVWVMDDFSIGELPELLINWKHKPIEDNPLVRIKMRKIHSPFEFSEEE